MSHDNERRLFLHLESVQGERLSLSFDIQDKDTEEFLDLSEYDLVGSVLENYNDTAVADFIFAENEEDSNIWDAYIAGATTAALVSKNYEYEIRMTHKTSGIPETLFYGTWELAPTRLGVAP